MPILHFGDNFGRNIRPYGNTGGANVSPFKPMPVPVDLDMRIQQAREIR